MIWYILAFFFLAASFILVVNIPKWTSSPFLATLLQLALVFVALWFVFTPTRLQNNAETKTKNELRSATMLNITSYQTGGAVLIECTADNANIVLNLLTTNVRGKEELLHFDTSTGEYEEINIYTYKKWYPYECEAKK